MALEGWAYVTQSGKRHYFRSRELGHLPASLCNRWQIGRESLRRNSEGDRPNESTHIDPRGECQICWRRKQAERAQGAS